MKKVVTGENPKIIEKRVGSGAAGGAPRVSVVIPAYNVGEFIRETLDSVLAQTFALYEIILVNDGSGDTEKLEKVLAPYFENITYIHQENGGAAAARNTAINAARGEYLAFLDGDDIWLSEFLAAQVEFLEKNNYEMAYCDAQFFGDSFFKAETFMRQSPSKGDVTTESLLKCECNVITSGTVCLKKAVVENGLFDSQAHRVEDFDLWFRMAKAGVRIGYQRRVLLKYRVRASGLTGDNIKRAERNIKALEVIKAKNEFTESERRIWREQMDASRAELELEKGKSHLIEGSFPQARAHFRAANKYYRKLKLRIVILLLGVYPQLVVKFFKKMRSRETSFIATVDT